MVFRNCNKEDERVTVYEVSNKDILIIKEKKYNEEWKLNGSVQLPAGIIEQVGPTIARLNRASYSEDVIDLDSPPVSPEKDENGMFFYITEPCVVLPLEVRKIIFNAEEKLIPLYENQLGLERDIQLLEMIWGKDVTRTTPEKCTSPPWAPKKRKHDTEKNQDEEDTPVKRWNFDSDCED